MTNLAKYIKMWSTVVVGLKLFKNGLIHLYDYFLHLCLYVSTLTHVVTKDLYACMQLIVSVSCDSVFVGQDLKDLFLPLPTSDV